MNESALEIVPGLKLDLFVYPEGYEKHREDWVRHISPKITHLNRARALSEHESRNRIVD